MTEIIESVPFFTRPKDTFRIFIFNPETDYALAAGNAYYNPPAKIKAIRKQGAFSLAAFAFPGDVILLLDEMSELNSSDAHTIQKLEEREISVIGIKESADLIRRRLKGGKSPLLVPWGWNHSLVHTLNEAGIDSKWLRTDSEMDNLRELAHRRTSVRFNRVLQSLLPYLEIFPAQECFSLEEALSFISRNGGAFLKTPWSSSGRGVTDSYRLSESKLKEWIRGCIHRQGSVMAERIHSKTGDFATEWRITHGKVHFLGFSMFRTSREGRYLGNVTATDEEIERNLHILSYEWSPQIIDAQREALTSLVAPRYDGPVGIDMLTTTEGRIIPCVEINFRLTMGMMNLQLKRQGYERSI